MATVMELHKATNPVNVGIFSPKAIVLQASSLSIDIQWHWLVRHDHVSVFPLVRSVPLSLGAVNVVQWLTRMQARIRDGIVEGISDTCGVYL